MELLAVLFFVALVIVAGGLIAAALVYLPRLILGSAFADRLPGWLIIVASYLLSLVALKAFGSATSGMLFLLGFMFLSTTMYHLYWLLKEVGTGARLAIVSGVLLVIGGCGMKMSSSNAVPIPLELRIGWYFS